MTNAPSDRTLSQSQYTLLSMVLSAREHVEITRNQLDDIDALVAQMDNSERDALLAALCSPQFHELDGSSMPGEVLSQAQRLAHAISTSLYQTALISQSDARMVADSFSPQELGMVFSKCGPERLLPKLLALKAYVSLSVLDGEDYSYLFDPSSDTLDDLELEQRKALANGFVEELIMQLEEKPRNGRSVPNTLIEKFGETIAKFPEFNEGIIEKIGGDLIQSFPNLENSPGR